MSGGQRGGGGSAAVRAVASALGINRHEMSNYIQPARSEPPPLFPPLTRSVLPAEECDRQKYMVATKDDLLKFGFRDSPYFLEEKKIGGDVKRYTDKYRETNRTKLQPDWSRIPEELCWQKKNLEQNPSKKRKLDDAMGELVNEKLKRLEENAAEKDEEPEEKQEETSDVEDEEEKERVGDEAVSDDDYLEEDNDYATGYFDNGEGYGAGSDDDLDADGDL
ncbi:unnamed protein product, partial [Mesorhabditis belari]|uniref:DNA-directed RNA polymerase III subunit n=1 Tax=Mesorhabditis belari TaxID=2138241 RepID=A0AAF3EVB4_9BILA